MRPARFTATSPMSRRGCRRSPSRVRCWSPRGCSVKSPGCSSPRSAVAFAQGRARTPFCSVSSARAAEDAAWGARQLTPLVGREEEIAMLMRRWERARQGDGQLVLIVGEPGSASRG